MKKVSRRSKFGWLDCLTGILLIALGIYTFVNPKIALSGVVFIYSIAAIINGIVDIVFYVSLKSNTGAGAAVTLVLGIIETLAGFLLLLNPIVGQWLFYIVFPVWFIAHSISRIANHRFIRRAAGKAVYIASLIINTGCIILGVLMIFNPAIASVSLGYLVALALVLHGADNMIEAFSSIGAGDIGGERNDDIVIEYKE